MDRLGNVTGYRKASTGISAGTLDAVFDYDAFGQELRSGGFVGDRVPWHFSTRFSDVESGTSKWAGVRNGRWLFPSLRLRRPARGRDRGPLQQRSLSEKYPLWRQGDQQPDLPAGGGGGGEDVTHFDEAGLAERVRAVFTDKSGAGEGGAVHADGEVGPVCQVGAGLDFEGDAGAVERAGEKDAQALAVGVGEEAAARQ